MKIKSSYQTYIYRLVNISSSKLLLVVFLLLFINSNLFAQFTYNGPADGFLNVYHVVNTELFPDEILVSDSQRNHIFHIVPKLNHQRISSSISHDDLRKFYFLNENNKETDSIDLFRSFSGISQTNSYPPDPYIAVGPEHIVEVVNRQFRIADKEGNTLKDISASQWFMDSQPGVNPFDPKVIYDHFNNRWVMVWLAYFSANSTAFYLISVSDDDNPLGIWYNRAIPSNQNGNTAVNNWADYQGVGFDNEAIYLSSSQFNFNGFYDYDKLRIFSKAELYNPGPVNWKDFWYLTYPHNSNNIYSIRPTRMFDIAGKFYFVHVPAGGANFITLINMDDPLNNPILTATNIPVPEYDVPQDALQKGGSSRIEGGGCHLRNEPFYINGNIHYVHSIKNTQFGNLSSLNYVSINPLSGLAFENIEIGDGEHFHFYPSLAINKKNKKIISFSRSSLNEYAGAFYIVLADSNQWSYNTEILQEGTAYYNRTGGGGRNRWGDYSGAWLDPTDSLSFWIMTEYVAALNTWGTWIGAVKHLDIIPVQLESINCTVEGSDVLINWVTSTETNNWGFEIERTSIAEDSNHNNSLEWRSIAFIKGKGTTVKKSYYSFRDFGLNPGNYIYRLKQIDYNGTFEYSTKESVEVFFPFKYQLKQNYPNPFNPHTTIEYTIPIQSFTRIIIYDVLGNKIKTLNEGIVEAGSYKIVLDSEGMASGVYFLKMESENYSSFKKMILLK